MKKPKELSLTDEMGNIDSQLLKIESELNEKDSLNLNDYLYFNATKNR